MSTSSGPLDLSLVIAEDQLEEGSLAVLSVIRPHWARNSITFKIFTDGITNKLLGCFHQDYLDDVVLVRVYGHKTDLLIDRNAETRNIKILHEAGYAPRLYATFVNGLAYEYVPGEVLTEVTCRDPVIFPLIARMMAQMHRLKDPNAADPTEPIIWKKLKQFFDLVPNSFKDPVKQDRFRKQIPSKEQMEQEICAMKPELEALGSPVVFCHNDLLLANVIYDPSKKCVTFIDYEYSSYNYQAFDIGNHFAEFTGVGEFNSSLYPSEEFQMQWLCVYLETFQDREVSDTEVYNLYVKVNKFSPVSRFFWMLWALIQAEHSNIEFDFVGYAVNLWKEYRTRKEQFQSLALKDV